MKKIFTLLFVLSTLLAQEAVSRSSAANTANIDSSAKAEPQEGLFITPSVFTHNYGVFKIGYAYQFQHDGEITKQGLPPFNYTQNYNMVYFGIERGWIGGPGNLFMAGGYLDGGLGQTFYLSLGAKFSLFLLDGWIIPYAGVGYQIEHLGFSNDTIHHLMNAGVVSLGAHFNVARGFGIDLELRSGTPFYMIRSSELYGNPSIVHLGAMISFSFYDFSL